MRIRDKVAELAGRFEAAGIETPKADARVLTAFVLGREPVYLRIHPEEEIDIQDIARIDACAVRRFKREPVSKITGTRGFWRLDFKVTPDVLDPRPDSETLIEKVLEILPDKTASLKILDLGTGTGCLAQALLCEYIRASAVGTDISPAALAVAEENAAFNGLKERFAAVLADWNEPGWENNFKTPFDVVISNPPYIAEFERASLAPEVREYDPPQALFGGPDGLDPYRKIVLCLPRLLKKGGLFVCEFGKGQEEDVRRIICTGGGEFNSFGVDLGGVTRCLCAFF